MSSECSDESETHSTTHEESSTDHSRGSAIVKRGSYLMRPRSNSAPVRHGHFRPFLSSGKAQTRYRGKVPPQSMVPVLEGHESADDGYESMLCSQVLSLFDVLADIAVPTVSAAVRGAAMMEDVAPADKATRASRSKSLSRRHGMGVLKEIAQQQAAATELTPGKDDPRQAEATLKSLMDDFDAAMDAAESLMMVEDLNWAGLFHHRYLFTSRLIRACDTDHIKNIVECFLSASSESGEAYSACRKQASKLMQYIVSHTSDPDGALLGLAPSTELSRRMTASLDDVYGENATRPELRDKILGYSPTGELCFPTTGALSHGMLVFANLPGEGLKFVRFSRIDPTRTHMLQVWKNACEKESVVLDIGRGVFTLDEPTRSMLGADPKLMGKLVYNPLTALHVAVDELLEERVTALLAAHSVDLFLLRLSEDQIASESLDLSAYDETGELKVSGQALCTKLLSLFDVEKKKLLALRGSLKQSEIEDVASEVADRVEAFMSEADLSALFAPIKLVEIEVALSLGLRCVASFQHALDKHVVHVEELIDYVIVNWKKLSDVKLRPELRDGGAAIRQRSMSKGSLRSFLAANKDKVEAGSPLLNRNSKEGSAPSTPGSKKKTLLSLFQKKE